VTAVASSTKCISLLDAGFQYDLLRIDLILPAPHGFALKEIVKRRNKRQRIVYITGYFGLITPDDLRNAGVPILARLLVDTVRRVIETRAAFDAGTEKKRPGRVWPGQVGMSAARHQRKCDQLPWSRAGARRSVDRWLGRALVHHAV
jgi:hypothetical protein